jgi:hypothetical protein
VFPLAALHVVLRARKGRNGASIPVIRIPAAVIEVEMRVDDDIDLVGRDFGLFELVRHLGAVAVDLL